MSRRIVMDERALRYRRIGLDHLQDVAASGAEALPVTEATLHIRITADGIETVLLVVVDRRLLAQAREHRMRVLEVLGIVGIPIEARCTARGHTGSQVSSSRRQHTSVLDRCLAEGGTGTMQGRVANGRDVKSM